jgi:hypothetical protein
MTHFALALSILLAACGSTEQQVTEPAPTTEKAPAKSKTPAAAPHDHGEDAKAMYACPMHPDETSHEPGTCSKCGMALVEQGKHDHDAHEHKGHGEGHDH